MEDITNRVRSAISDVREKGRRDIVDIYRTIGLSRHDQWENLEKFRENVDQVWAKSFSDLQERRDRVKRGIEGLRSNIASIKGQIGDRLDDEELEGLSGKNLTQQMRMLKKVEDEKKHMRASMITDLNAAIQQVNQYNKQLQGGGDIRASMEKVADRKLGAADAVHCFDVLPAANEETPDLTKAQIDRVRAMVAVSREQVGHRRSFLNKWVKDTYKRLEFMALMPSDTGNPPEDATVDVKLDTIVVEKQPCSLDTTFATIQRVCRREKQLNEIEDRRLQQMQLGAEIIQDLWAQLGTPEQEQSHFFRFKKGLSAFHLKAFSDERSRLEHQAKFKLQELYEEISERKENRKFCGPEGSSSGSQQRIETTQGLIDELRRVQAIAKEMRPLLKKIKDREDILDNLRDVEEEAKKWGIKRFSMPHVLKHEEKVRGRVKKYLPLLQKELKEGLVKWLNDHGRPLLYKGKSYLETVLAYDEEKKRRRSRRGTTSSLTRGGRSKSRH